MQKTTAITSAPATRAGFLAQLRSAVEFRYFAAFTVVATYALIVLGGTVRATGSGTACPDWPLCYGRVVPPIETRVMIEYSHRVTASVVGFLIVGMIIWAWRRKSDDPLLRPITIAAAVLLAAQIIVGGVTVDTETAATVVAIHLSIALTLLSTLIYVGAAAWIDEAVPASRRLPVVPLLAALCVLALIVSGAFVSQENAGLAYPDWPLFAHKVTPALSRVGEIHYAHRLVAVLSGVGVGAVAWQVLRHRRSSAPVIVGATAALVLYVAQVFIGAGNVWLSLPTVLRVAHLALASALWSVLVFTVIWAFLNPEPARRPAEPAMEAV